MSLRAIRLLLWGLATLALLGFAVFQLARKPDGYAAGQAMAVGAPFTLTAVDGKPFSSKALDGRPHAIFFGFTHCPDVCPTTLARLAKLRRQVGEGEDAFDIVLVSVDPERDTPAELSKYVKMFATPVIALTGTTAEIDQVSKAYGIYRKIVPENNGTYTVDHSAQVLLFNRDGSFAGTIAYEENDAPALQKLRNIANS